MARFDVYTYSAHPDANLVLDVQADILSMIPSCVVIPLVKAIEAQAEEFMYLKPVLQIKNEDYVLITTDMGPVYRKNLGKQIANLEGQRYVIMNAIDFLFQGF